MGGVPGRIMVEGLCDEQERAQVIGHQNPWPGIGRCSPGAQPQGERCCPRLVLVASDDQRRAVIASKPRFMNGNI